MRDIIFRGKRVDNGEWVEGYLRFIYIDGKNQNGFIYTDKAGIYNQDKCMNYDVLTETVGQYTGLEDKNGKKIFEGDVVKDRWKGLGIVEYSENNGCWLSIPCEDGLYQCFKDGNISEPDCSNFNVLMQQGEVVGNVHDNPELLK